MEAGGERGGPVTVELSGVQLYTHHGVTAAEREIGQRLEVDVSLEPTNATATATDEIGDTVDYSEACELVVAAATESGQATLERVAQLIAERLLDRFDLQRVRVRVAKPDPPVGHPVREAAVELSLPM